MQFRLLRPDEVECRVARVIGEKGVMLLLYKDARCDMNILDETVGAESWQRNHELINGNLFCNVGILIGDQWVWKQDVGVESNTEKEKGQASDSFKRACFNWGIGRELYTAPDMVVWDPSLIKDGKCYEAFRVEEIQYDGRRICYVRIKAQKQKKEFEFGQTLATKELKKSPIGEARAIALKARCDADGISVQDLLGLTKAKTMDRITEEQLSWLNINWDSVRAKYGNHGTA